MNYGDTTAPPFLSLSPVFFRVLTQLCGCVFLSGQSQRVTQGGSFKVSELCAYVALLCIYMPVC